MRCSVLKTRGDRETDSAAACLEGRQAALFRGDDRSGISSATAFPPPRFRARTLVAVHVGDIAGHQASGSASSIKRRQTPHLTPTTPDQPRPGEPPGLSARLRQSVWRCLRRNPVVSTSAAAGTAACVSSRDGDGTVHPQARLDLRAIFPCAGLGRRFFVGRLGLLAGISRPHPGIGSRSASSIQCLIGCDPRFGVRFRRKTEQSLSGAVRPDNLDVGSRAPADTAGG